VKKQRSSCISGCLIAFFSLCLIGGVISAVILQSVSITPQSVSIELRNLSIPILTATLAATPNEPNTSPSLSPGTVSVIPPILNSADPKSAETYQVLHDTIVPNWDGQDLAWRFKRITHLSFPNNLPPNIYDVGDQETFFASNDDDNGNFQVNATLRYKSTHLYFWIENGTDYDVEKLKAMGDEFEKTIYPTDRKYFGSEWTPGIDNDVHLYVLYAKNLGKYVAGYFSSADETPTKCFICKPGNPLGLITPMGSWHTSSSI